MLEIIKALFPAYPAAAIAIGVLVAFVVCGDSSRLLAPRNLALAALLGSALPLADLLRFGSHGGRFAGLFFTVLFVYTAGYAIWAFVLARRPAPGGWRVNLPTNGMRALVAAVVALDVAVVLLRRPDDAGIYTNLGAQRWMETGSLPYADTLLTGFSGPGHGAAATYGPLLYAAHLPFQLALGRPDNPPSAGPRTPGYRWPAGLATKCACLTFHLAGLLALFGIVRRVAGTDMGLAAVALYAGSPYVIGLGGDRALVGGLVYISHIAPTAVVLLALLAIGNPVLSGILLAGAAGLLFWPLFLFPAWFGWRWWRREGPWRFAAAFALTGVALAALVVRFVHATDVASAVRLFMSSTLEHQEGAAPGQYGVSAFSFWGTHPRLAAFWAVPLVGGTSLFKPLFLAYASLSLGAFWLARGRTIVQLAAVTAGLAAAIQLWHSHGTGTYIEWSYPFLLIALLCAGRPDPAQRRGA